MRPVVPGHTRMAADHHRQPRRTQPDHHHPGGSRRLLGRDPAGHPRPRLRSHASRPDLPGGLGSRAPPRRQARAGRAQEHPDLASSMATSPGHCDLRRPGHAVHASAAPRQDARGQGDHRRPRPAPAPHRAGRASPGHPAPVTRKQARPTLPPLPGQASPYWYRRVPHAKPPRVLCGGCAGAVEDAGGGA
jgi:hypothetical protein